MGFPIRKSADQSFFAAPHGLSQRSTSFIASQRQGIHQTPLRHLIALIINAHRQPTGIMTLGSPTALMRKTSLLEIVPTARGQARRQRCAWPSSSPWNPKPRGLHQGPGCRKPTLGAISSSRCQTAASSQDHCRRATRTDYSRTIFAPGWWSQTGSNRRPPACKAGALPTELWPRFQRSDIGGQRSEWLI